MPAVGYTLWVCPARDGEAILTTRLPPWWDHRELFSTYRARTVELQGLAYDDSAILLTGWEASAFDQQCREQFAADSRSQEPHNVDLMARLKSALESAKWVIIEAYEWESGLE